MYIHTYVDVCMHAGMCVCMHVNTYVGVCVCVCVCARAHTCVCVCNIDQYTVSATDNVFKQPHINKSFDIELSIPSLYVGGPSWNLSYVTV
jgi:hypothetical protein